MRVLLDENGAPDLHCVHVEHRHHGHVFVLDIVAVKDIWPGEVSEVKGDLHLIVGSEVDSILDCCDLPFLTFV